MAQVAAHSMGRYEEALAHLPIRQTLSHEPRNGELRVGHRGPASIGALCRHHSAAHSQGPQPLPHPAGIPASPGSGVERERPVERSDTAAGSAAVHGNTTQILQR